MFNLDPSLGISIEYLNFGNIFPIIKEELETMTERLVDHTDSIYYWDLKSCQIWFTNHWPRLTIPNSLEAEECHT
jgi:hypothetical protein